MKTNPQNRDNNHKPEALRHNERMKVTRRNIDEWVERFMNGERGTGYLPVLPEWKRAETFAGADSDVCLV